MDDVAAYNVRRWKALAAAGSVLTRPLLVLDAEGARARIDPDGRLGDPAGKRVLVLAGGGGQQSVAFAKLGARVTVADLSDDQLARDRTAAAHHGLTIETVRADMRDLSRLPEAEFDVVWQPYSINFVPAAPPVFDQVARVIRPGGVYHVQFANPFVAGVTEHDWNRDGYVLRQPYVDGATVAYQDQEWVYPRRAPGGQDPDAVVVPGPREYRHTLATVVNGLVARGFAIEHLADRWDQDPDPAADPGTWPHLVLVVPPWLALWTRFRPAA